MPTPATSGADTVASSRLRRRRRNRDLGCLRKKKKRNCQMTLFRTPKGPEQRHAEQRGSGDGATSVAEPRCSRNVARGAPQLAELRCSRSHNARGAKSLPDPLCSRRYVAPGAPILAQPRCSRSFVKLSTTAMVHGY